MVRSVLALVVTMIAALSSSSGWSQSDLVIRVLACAQSADMSISANFQGSLESIFGDGEGANGEANWSSKSEFLGRFSEEQRLEAYYLYILCIRERIYMDNPRHPRIMDRYVFGNRIFSEDTVIVAREVVFNDGAYITIRDGSVIEIAAQALSIEGSVFFSGIGEKGAAGEMGDECAHCYMGPWTSGLHHNDMPRRHREWLASAAPDSPYDHGKKGKPGKRGGPGASIEIRYGRLDGRLDSIEFDLRGGEGGEGGIGGPGRKMISGATGQSKYGRRGPPGDRGDNGPEGQFRVCKISEC